MNPCGDGISQAVTKSHALSLGPRLPSSRHDDFQGPAGMDQPKLIGMVRSNSAFKATLFSKGLECASIRVLWACQHSTASLRFSTAPPLVTFSMARDADWRATASQGKLDNCLGTTGWGKARNSFPGKNTRMKLSVMMITYNHERFIAQAIESVLAQQVNFDYEIVIGEDCSTDGTRAVIMDFHRRYPGRIVPLLRDRNLGAMRNLTETLAVCRGKYVALLEGDDYWTHEDKLQMQINFLDQHPDYAICCHRAQFVDETGGGQSQIYPTLPSGTYTIADLFHKNWIVTCSVIYRWGSVGSLPNWFATLKMGDWPLNILVGKAGKIHLMEEVMSVYRIHQGGIWSSLSHLDRLRATTGMLTALDKHLGFQFTRTIRQTLAQLYCEMACQTRRDANRRATGKYLVNCIRNGGWQIPGSRRTLRGLAVYTLIGSRYRVFSTAKPSNPG